MRKKRLLSVILVIAVLAGIALAAYPLFSLRYTEKHQSKVHTEYENILAAVDSQDIKDARDAAQRYNEQLLSGVVFGNMEESPACYDNLLNLSGNGIMCYVEIPAIDVNIPVYHGTGEAVLEKGAGHMVGTSLPIGGEGSHAVISAHTGMATEKMFTDLGQLKKGDHFVIHVLNDDLVYSVDQISTVLPTEIDSLKIDPHEDLVTLVTCTPYGVNSHRLLVRGHRIFFIEPVEKESLSQEISEEKQDDSTWLQKYWHGILTGLIIVAAAGITAAVILLIRRRKK